MGRLDVHIRHGGGSLGPLALTGAVIGIIGAAGGASGALSDLQSALLWVGGTLAVAISGLAAFLIRAMRRGWRPNYVRSMHGPTERDRQLDQVAALRHEIALTRAARYRLEVAQRMNGDLGEPITAPFITKSGLYQQLPPIPGHEG